MQVVKLGGRMIVAPVVALGAMRYLAHRHAAPVHHVDAGNVVDVGEVPQEHRQHSRARRAAVGAGTAAVPFLLRWMFGPRKVRTAFLLWPLVRRVLRR